MAFQNLRELEFDRWSTASANRVRYRTTRIILVSVAMLVLVFPNSLSASLVFDFSATVSSIDDWDGTNSSWNQARVGSHLSGRFAYDHTLSATETFGTGLARWEIPITQGGDASLSLVGPSFQISAQDKMLIQVYKWQDPSFPLGGIDFQVFDSTPPAFTIPNATVVGAGFLLSFLSIDPALSTFPNLPTAFNPLNQWNFPTTDPGPQGFAWVDYRYGNGGIRTDFLHFKINQVTSVPEPSGFALGIFAALLRRRVSRNQ